MGDIDDLVAAVAAGPQGPEVGAFFDFDGTLINGYSAALYFRQRLTSGAMSPQELIGTLVEVFNMQQRGHDVTRLVGVGLGALRGTALTDLEDMGQQLFRSRISGQLYPDARRLVRAHLRAGHTVALASSATQVPGAGGRGGPRDRAPARHRGRGARRHPHRPGRRADPLGTRQGRGREGVRRRAGPRPG